MSGETHTPVITAKGLVKYYPIRHGLFSRVSAYVKAVDGINLELFRGETLGLVGESGCGKTTTGRVIIQLERPTAGEIYLDGSPNLATLSNRQLFPFRRKLQMIFQDPFSSLNPRMTVGSIIAEPLTIHRLARGAARRERVESLMEMVGIDPAHSRRFPHEFSGGQRQRIGIARALAVEPEIIIADEPVSSLDVSIQAQIINLLRDLQERLGLSYIFISHEIAVVAYLSHRIAVMYLGKLVELGKRDDFLNDPLHPYTKALLVAVPQTKPGRKGKRIILEGDVPSPINPPQGCSFHPRCPHRFEPCDKKIPPFFTLGENHQVACWLYEGNRRP